MPECCWILYLMSFVSMLDAKQDSTDQHNSPVKRESWTANSGGFHDRKVYAIESRCSSVGFESQFQ